MHDVDRSSHLNACHGSICQLLAAQHAFPEIGAAPSQIDRDRPWAPDDGKRDLAQLRALDPMPVLGGAGVVSSILNCILKLTSASPNADIFSRSVLRAAELDQRGHKRAVEAGSCSAQTPALHRSRHPNDAIRHPNDRGPRPARQRRTLSSRSTSMPRPSAAATCFQVSRTPRSRAARGSS